MEAKMQMTNLIEAGASEVQPKLPADYSAMKEKLIRAGRTGGRHSGRVCNVDRSGRLLRNAAESSAMLAVA